MELPKLACCNFIPDVRELKDLALSAGFDGVEWTFNPDNLPQNEDQVQKTARDIAHLFPLEVRYHAALPRTDPGHHDEDKAGAALDIFKKTCRLVSDLGGRYMTLHIGLNRDSTHALSWEKTIDSLKDLVAYARTLGLDLCLENLAWGWTSKPQLFEKLLRKTNALATLDLGHALVSPTVSSHHFALEDFVLPHPNRFVAAHIYHEEIDHQHTPPRELSDLADRLNLLWRLPRCDWWLLELREEKALRQTLAVVQEYLSQRFDLQFYSRTGAMGR